MSNKINILYFKLRKTEDSLLNQIIFHSDVQLHIIENENINILMFLKNNREYFIEKYSLIFIELDYLADNVNNRNQFVLSRWNNNLDDLIREKIVVLNYNNFLDGHNLAKIKIKAFYQKEALLEFLDNEKLLKEKVFLPHEQTSVIEDEFCIFKNPDKEDSQKEDLKEDLKDDEQENKHNAESTGDLEGEENTETSKTVESEDKQEIDQEQEKVQEQEDLTSEEEEQEDSTEQEQKVESEEKQSEEQPQDSKEKLPNQTQEKTPEDLFQNEIFNTQTDTTIELNDEQEDEEDEGDSVDRKDLRQFKEKTKKLLSSQVGNLLKKRVKEKEPKKEKREKKQPKTLPESEIKVKKEINKIFPENLPSKYSKYIVNVFGTKEKIGTTYTSLYLALKAKEEGYSSCLIVEDNDYKILSSSIQYSAIYKASQKREANQHDIIVNDIGVYDVNDSEFFEKFYMGNMSVLVVAINYPNTFSQHNIRRYLENENDYPNIIALNFSDEDEFKQFEKEYKRHTKVIQIPFKALD